MTKISTLNSEGSVSTIFENIIGVWGSLLAITLLVYMVANGLEVSASTVFSFCVVSVFIGFLFVYSTVITGAIKISQPFKPTIRLLTLLTGGSLGIIWFLVYCDNNFIGNLLPFSLEVIFLFLMIFSYLVFEKVEKIKISKFLVQDKLVEENSKLLLLGISSILILFSFISFGYYPSSLTFDYNVNNVTTSIAIIYVCICYFLLLHDENEILEDDNLRFVKIPTKSILRKKSTLYCLILLFTVSGISTAIFEYYSKICEQQEIGKQVCRLSVCNR